MYDITIIGGGIVGLSTCYQLLKNYPDKKILLLEKDNDLALHQTGNNSGVIHSGIYYKPRSLKALNCRRGIIDLKKFCDRYDIEYEFCGKLIVASNKNEIKILDHLYNRGIQNGISGLKKLRKNQISNYEPYAKGEAAIFCPETGIINYVNVCNQIIKIIKNSVKIATNAKVTNIEFEGETVLIKSTSKDFKTKFAINCAGLFSDRVVKLTGGKIKTKIIPFRGEYYLLKKEAQHLVKNLIYPVPDPKFPFLGVHFTRRIDGSIEAGPNAVLAFSREGYTKLDFNLRDMCDYLFFPGFWRMSQKYWDTGLKEFYRSFSKKAFLKSLQKLIPNITKDHIKPSSSGVRAQALSINGNLIDDFLIKKSKQMIHVVNAPSPAATSAFSIGNKIKKLYQELAD